METTVSRCGTNSFKRWNLSFLHNEPDEATRRIPKNGCPPVHIRIRLSIFIYFFYCPAPTVPDRNPEIPDRERLTTYHKKGNRPIRPQPEPHEQDKREPFRSHLSYNSAQASNSGLYITNYPYLCGVSL